MQHPGQRMDEDRLVPTHDSTISAADSVTHGAQRRRDLFRNATFHQDRAALRPGNSRRGVRLMPDARGVTGLLQVHAEIDDVQEHLGVPLRLHVAAHDTVDQEWLAVLRDHARHVGVQ